MPSTRSLRLASAAALTAAMPLVGVAVIPAATLPAAVADDLSQCRAVSSASMAWGIKQSFRNYLTGPIASGGWDLDGVAYSGSAPNAAEGAFNFTADPSRSRVEGDDADLPMNGKIHLTGHGGIINVTLDNFELQIRGNRAQLLADGRYLAADPAAVVSLVGGPPAFTRQPVATFSLERTLTQAGSSTGSATVTGSSWIHENLNKGLLGSYGEGKNDGDPVSITVATSGAGDCGVDRNAVMASSAGQKDASPTASAPATAANAPEATQPAQQNTQNNSAAAASPVADTTTCDAVTGAQVGWGLKQSFRNYLTGPIAMGNWQLSEVGFSGSQGGADGQFQFSADPAAIRVSGTDADIPLKGSVHLTGHFGALDITYSNMKVKVRGTTAQFIADYRSNTVSSFTATAQVTGAKTGTQVPIAQFDLTQPITEAAANSGTISLNGPGYITEDGNQSLGGNYGAGNNGADPINISLKTSGAGCGIGTGGGLGAIATAGQASSGGSASAADAVTGTPDLGVAPRVSATTTGAATGAASAADTTCAAGSGDRKVVETRMGWGIKDSFRSYIKGSIAKGDWTPTGGAVYNSGNFIFSGSDGTVGVSGGTATSGTLLFGGSVLFTGHEGVLRTVISSPEIRINGNSASLIANVESNDRSGNPKDYGRIVVADLSLTKASVSEGVLDGSATAALSADGATALAGFYKAGDALDPVSFRAALSDDCSGNKAASLGDKPRDESDGEDAADEGAQSDGKLTVTSAPDSTNADDSEDKDTGLVAFLKDPASMVPSIIAIIAAAAAGVMAVRLRRTNRRIDEVAAAAGVGGGEPGQDD